MATSKILIDGVGIDLTNDTITSANDIAVGKVGHTKDGSVVTGTFTNDADATAADIQSGKTAYVNGAKITGTGGSTPTQTKSMTLGASAPSTVTPDSGYALSSVSPSIDTSVIKAENIAQGATILGIAGTHSGGGGATEPYIEETFDSDNNLIDFVLHGYTIIRDFAFDYCTELVSPVIPDVITSIGMYAFDSCENLDLPSLPSGLTTIGDNAFYNCIKLALTSLPSGLTTIGNNAFYGTKLALTSLPSGLTTIGDNAFDNCKRIINIEIACNLSGNNIFKSCSRLQKVWFRSTCTTVSASSANSCPFLSCSTSLQIYCEATSKPSGYGAYFNRTGANGATTVTVVYGQTTKPW